MALISEASVMIMGILKRVNRLMNYLSIKKDRLRLKGLMKRGLKVGNNVYIFKNVEFDLGYPYMIEIGDNCRISQDVLILAHDATTFNGIGATKIAPVKILEGTFIGQRAIILPGVTIGPNAMVAAGSVVNRNVPEGMAVAGNPARPYTTYNEIIERIKIEVKNENTIDICELGNIGIIPDRHFKKLNRNKIFFVKSVPKYDPFYVNTNINEIRRNAIEAYSKLNKSKFNRKSD